MPHEARFRWPSAILIHVPFSNLRGQWHDTLKTQIYLSAAGEALSNEEERLCLIFPLKHGAYFLDKKGKQWVTHYMSLYGMK